jgi:hypothetical protein
MKSIFYERQQPHPEMHAMVSRVVAPAAMAGPEVPAHQRVDD